MKRLVVVTGPPASGKTTLARALVPVLDVPLLEKDAIKEALFDVLGTGDAVWSRKLGRASFETMFRLAQRLPEAILEGNFPTEAAARLNALAESPIQIFCSAPFGVLLKRSEERRRHPGHLPPDEAVLAAMRSPKVLDLGGPLLKIDPVSESGPEEVARWIEAQPEWGRGAGN